MEPIKIVAEAGVNHNGSLLCAMELVDAAEAAGADVVKFQTFHPDQIVSRYAPKAAYQKRNTDAGESQLEMLHKLALSEDDQRRLRQHCRERGIDFLSTPFDPQSLQFLVHGLGLSHVKLGSGDLTNGPLLLEIAKAGVALTLSTGMATLEEVKQALAVLAYGYTAADNKPDWAAFRNAYAASAGKEALQDKVTLLHCTTDYPCCYEDVNLLAMDTLSETFKLPVGLSDHTEGIAIAIAAAARGAAVIEKHFTLDKFLPGPDHSASLSPDELRMLVIGVRQVENALGSGAKRPVERERQNIAVVRKSLVANADIEAGERFSPTNLAVKRPGAGASPMEYWSRLGQPAGRSYTADEEIDP